MTVPHVTHTNLVICSCGYRGYIVVPTLCPACETPWKYVYGPYVGHPNTIMLSLHMCTDNQLMQLISSGVISDFRASFGEEETLDIVFTELASRC